MLKVGIVGAGAMGCLFAAKLAEAGNEVLVADHNAKTVSAIRKRGVGIREKGRVRRVRVSVGRSPGNFQDFDLVLVMVKSYSTKAVARDLRGRVGTKSMILTLQNGLGNVETLTRRFGGKVLAGSTTEASLRLEPGLIEHTGRGLTLVGELDGEKSGRVLGVVRSFNGAGFETKLAGKVRNVVWSKAILNSAINPVSALTRLQNGQLERFEGVRELMQEILEEGVRVAHAEGVRLRLGDLSRSLSRVLRATAANRSSMLQDVLGCRRTEVRELNGVIASLGRRHRIPTPTNTLLSSLVMGLEGSYERGR